MDGRRSRRRLLATLASLTLPGFTGCSAVESPGSESGSTHERTARGTGATTGGRTDDGAADPATADGTTDTDPTPTDDPAPGYGSPPGDPPLDPDGEWPMDRFDAGHTAANPDGEGLRDPERYWRLDAGRRAVLDGGVLFTLSSDDSLNRRDPTDLSLRSRTSFGPVGHVYGSAATDDRVYTTAFGEVFCTAADRDALHWRGPEHGMDGIGYPPVVTDDAVFVGSGGFEETPPQVRAFGLDGRQRWRTELPSEARTSPSVSGDRLMIGTQDGLVGLDATTGEVLYTVSESVSEFRVPVLDDGAAFATVNENRPGREVVSLDPADGTVRWRRELGGAYPPIVAGDRLYTEVDDAIAVLDSTDGERVGTLDADGIPVALAGEVVYARAREEVLAADVETGERLWRYDVDRDLDPGEGGYGIGITPAGGAVYVSVDGSVVGFGPGA